ncbi:hypothetical protein C485_15849 [Natrinema altunense JCM 12890]|uniref:Uncharacterized protein n=1 Tax=Natrinema altunense (strain JCM 12890 / CGMCC 1.3731 / AJ2) TaxID=1227494 RepID=L9ZF71_NATA2|nr:hypothetical protein C485_15849 [Natrinema altunense JCM 12890]
MIGVSIGSVATIEDPLPVTAHLLATVVRRVCGSGQVVLTGARSSPGSHPAGRRYHRNHHSTTATVDIARRSAGL